MPKEIIIFEERSTKKKTGKRVIHRSDFLLKINDNSFNPEVKNNYSRSIQKKVHNKYWNRINALFPKRYRLVIQISELIPVVIGRITETYRYYDGIHRNIAAHFHSWQTKDGAWDEEGIVLIECDSQLFKKLFDQYWFCLANEIQFKGYLIKPEDFDSIGKWNKQDDGPRKLRALMKFSTCIFDNNCNGFHYSVIKPKKL